MYISLNSIICPILFYKVITVPSAALTLSNAKWGTTVAALVQSNVLHAILEALQEAKVCPSAPYVTQVIIKTQQVRLTVQFVLEVDIVLFRVLGLLPFVLLVVIVRKEVFHPWPVHLGSTVQRDLRRLCNVQQEVIVLILRQ